MSVGDINSAIRKQVHAAKEVGVYPTLSALIGLAGISPTQFFKAVNKMNLAQLNELERCLGEAGIFSRAVENAFRRVQKCEELMLRRGPKRLDENEPTIASYVYLPKSINIKMLNRAKGNISRYLRQLVEWDTRDI